MFYSFAYTVTADDLVTAKYTLDMNLTAGVIHQVDVLFQKDCAHKINVQIFQGGHQLWPSNRGAAMRGDATIISFREFLELRGAINDLYALIWTTDDSVLKEIIIQIGILPREIIQPISFDQLVETILAL
ncbi:unnamed protein product [marine sediment metagenome]|uniref:Uncharacterized protein n=1 Tax=marine sediment metagenome TaxID=412755 RepID=X1RZB1_9ZZZZ